MKVHKHIDEHNVYNISNNQQPILLWNPPFHTPLPPYTGSQCWSEMIKVYLQSKGWVLTANCQLPTGHFQLFLSCYCVSAGQYN